MKEFKGGNINDRDRWFGIEIEPDFKEFKRWYHKYYKPKHGGKDITSRKEALDILDIFRSMKYHKTEK
ncbi:MAG TPA: hypothetical protein DCS19_03955 [Flavobacterium sp.]|nr:hypothetical protein [Flavobacterium sp.]